MMNVSSSQEIEPKSQQANFLTKLKSFQPNLKGFRISKILPIKELGQHLNVICSVAGAVIGVQFPAFLSQYSAILDDRQNNYELSLAEKLAECGKQWPDHILDRDIGVRAKQCIALYKNWYLEKKKIPLIHPDTLRQYEGDYEGTKKIFETYNKAAEGLKALKSSSTLMKPFSFLRHVGRSTASDAWKKCEWEIPITIEALIYAAVGFTVGSFAYTLINHTITQINQKMGRNKHE